MSIKYFFFLCIGLLGVTFGLTGCVPAEVEPSAEAVVAALPMTTAVPSPTVLTVQVDSLETAVPPAAINAPSTTYLPLVTQTPENMRLTISSANPRYIENESGSRVLLVGDAAWSLIAQLNNAQIDTYLEDRAARGFNAVLVELIEHNFATYAPSNIDKVPPFTGKVFTTPNNTYFDRADYAIEKARNLGIYVLLAPLYLGYAGTEEGWDSEVANASTADMRAWGEYVGQRYASYDNIIWVIGGDRNPLPLSSKLDAFVTGLTTHANQLITTHNDPNSIATNYNQTWLELNNVYEPNAAIPAAMQSAYNHTPIMPVFHIEGHYENEHGMTAQALRAQAYWSVLGGGVGHIFGNCPIWGFGNSNTAGFCGGLTNWQINLTRPGSVGMGYLAELFTGVAWDGLIPDSTHQLVTSGYGTLGDSSYVGVAINQTGDLAVIYMPSNRTMAINMSRFAGMVTAKWYDPTIGTYQLDVASPLVNSGTHNFSRPVANGYGDSDWVLLLEVAGP